MASPGDSEKSLIDPAFVRKASVTCARNRILVRFATCGRGVAAVLAALLTVAGCSPRKTVVAPAVSTVRFDIPSDPTTLNPLFAHVDANSVEQQLARLAFEPFIDVDERGRQIPVLLARVPTLANGDLSHDGRIITYHLRRNVHWQDGPLVTAHDVVFTLHAITDPNNPVRSREGYERITRVEQLDTSTVRVTLDAPWAPAVATIFSYGTAPQYVLPAHLLENKTELAQNAFNGAPVGNGPYRFRTWQRGERLIYTRNAAYWRGVPAVERLDIRIIPDPGTNLTLMRSDEIDWNLIAPSQASTLADKKNLKYAVASINLVAGIALNTKHPPLDDMRVRRAIAASIDRDGISTKITFGRYPPIDTAQPLHSWAHDPRAHLPKYDTAAADRLLDQAGWPRGAGGIRMRNGTRLALTYVQFPESITGKTVATFVQSELAARGMAITIKYITNAQLFLPAAQRGTLATGAYDLAYVPWSMGADPDDSFLLSCKGASNYMRWCDPTVDALERQAIETPDQAARTKLYAQIQERVADAVPIVYLFNPSYVYAYSDKLSGFAPNAFLPTWNAARWDIKGSQ